MPMMTKSAKDMERAQSAFHKKETQAREGATATAEYRAAAAAERAKTERLRALRIAKEEQDRKAGAALPAKPASAKKRK